MDDGLTRDVIPLLRLPLPGGGPLFVVRAGIVEAIGLVLLGLGTVLLPVVAPLVLLLSAGIHQGLLYICPLLGVFLTGIVLVYLLELTLAQVIVGHRQVLTGLVMAGQSPILVLRLNDVRIGGLHKHQVVRGLQLLRRGGVALFGAARRRIQSLLLIRLIALLLKFFNGGIVLVEDLEATLHRFRRIFAMVLKAVRHLLDSRIRPSPFCGQQRDIRVSIDNVQTAIGVDLDRVFLLIQQIAIRRLRLF